MMRETKIIYLTDEVWAQLPYRHYGRLFPGND